MSPVLPKTQAGDRSTLISAIWQARVGSSALIRPGWPRMKFRIARLHEILTGPELIDSATDRGYTCHE
jgi:hypothetical protein